MLTSRSHSKALKAGMFWTNPEPEFSSWELVRHRTSCTVLLLISFLFILSRKASICSEIEMFQKHIWAQLSMMRGPNVIKPTDLVSVDAVHFLLHDRVGLQHREENLHSCIQRAVVWCHRNQTQNKSRSANIQETIGCTAGSECTHAYKRAATSSETYS